MATMMAHIPTWGEIDRAESYLVCCKFDEAASLGSSILKQLLGNSMFRPKTSNVSESYNDDNEYDSMVESAGMVLVQSMKELQRASEIMKELKLLFGSISTIPVQIFLTGVCFQMIESPSTTVQGSLEEYLSSWSYDGGQYYSISDAEERTVETEKSQLKFSIGVDKYLEVVELYVITFLAGTLNITDLAISWVNKAALPEEKREGILRRLSSMSPSMVTRSSQNSISPQMPSEYTIKSDLLQEQINHKDFGSRSATNVGNTAREEILRLSRQRVQSFWFFPAIKVKFGKTQVVVSSGKVLFASLLLLFCYFTRKRHAALKRVLAGKALSIKNALLDLWQLAFSYQVNPLAAVQPLPTAMQGSR